MRCVYFITPANLQTPFHRSPGRSIALFPTSFAALLLLLSTSCMAPVDPDLFPPDAGDGSTAQEHDGSTAQGQDATTTLEGPALPTACLPACHAYARCDTEVDLPVCRCNPGFSGDGRSCEDIDECASGQSNCGAIAHCVNTVGSSDCSCNDGYTGDGHSCKDIDECASGLNNCGANAHCVNVAGSFDCSCNNGYTGDGYTCTQNIPTDCTTWDYTANALCPANTYNCDCANGCGSSSCGSTPPPPPTGGYETQFHHTTTGSSDGGKSLVLCPGQSMNFDSCYVGSVKIPRHGDDNGRETYWNMHQVPIGDIVCTKNGNSYKYRADQTTLFGNC